MGHDMGAVLRRKRSFTTVMEKEDISCGMRVRPGIFMGTFRIRLLKKIAGKSGRWNINSPAPFFYQSKKISIGRFIRVPGHNRGPDRGRVVGTELVDQKAEPGAV
jgi:hypothetical protein